MVVKAKRQPCRITPFSFDITAALSGKGNNQLVVKVWDPTDEGLQPRGKQVSDPEGIWYPPVSGILADGMDTGAGCRKTYQNLSVTPDIDRNLLTGEGGIECGHALPTLWSRLCTDGDQLVATGKSMNAQSRWKCPKCFPEMPSCGSGFPLTLYAESEL